MQIYGSGILCYSSAMSFNFLALLSMYFLDAAFVWMDISKENYGAAAFMVMISVPILIIFNKHL